MRERVRIGILGASGYTGAELLRLLGDHPRAEIRALTAERQAGKPIGEVFPQLAALRPADARAGSRTSTSAASTSSSAACRTRRRRRSSASCRAAPRWSTSRPISGCAIPPLYERTYGHPHQALEPQARRGLRPDRALPRRDPRAPGWSPIPGCYTTAAELPLVPLLKARADPAGRHHHRRQVGRERRRPRRQAGQPVHRGRRGRPRLRRRHPPAHARDRAVPRRFRRRGRSRVTFTPHLMPMSRGILATIYVRLAAGAEPRRPARQPRAAPTRASPSSTCCRSRPCRRPATSAAPISA